MSKDYTDNLLFDNFEETETDELSSFSLEAIARNAAQKMIQAALETEVTEFLQRLRYEKSDGEEIRGYRNGHHQGRTISTAVGGLKVQVPRVSDNSEPFVSKIVKPYKRRSEALDTLFPKLFVEGLATRDFEPSLRFLVGQQALLSPSSISRLNKQFKDEYENWEKRDLSNLKIAYIWADGIYLKAGVADQKRCLLVIIGVDMTGRKHLLTMKEGFRESADALVGSDDGLEKAWLKRTGDSDSRWRIRILGGIAESVATDQRTALLAAQDAEYLGQVAETGTFRSGAEIASDLFSSESGSGRKISQRIDKRLEGSRILSSDGMFVGGDGKIIDVFEMPEEHWKHLRTTNVIESPFATVRLRTDAARRFRSARSGTHLVFKILQSCEQRWRIISHPEKLKEVKMPQTEN